MRGRGRYRAYDFDNKCYYTEGPHGRIVPGDHTHLLRHALKAIADVSCHGFG
jgi:hypothetical protein